MVTDRYERNFLKPYFGDIKSMMMLLYAKKVLHNLPLVN